MITVEKFSYEDGIRCIDKVEYNSVDEFERDIVLDKIAGTHIGHKIYDISLSEFDSLSQVERDTAECISWFDRDAWTSGNTVIQDIHTRLSARGAIK